MKINFMQAAKAVGRIRKHVKWNANIRMNKLEVLVHINMFNLSPVHTIPDSLCIGLVFIPDRRSVDTAPEQSDTLCIVLAKRFHSALKVV